ncbi:hypothetical protein FSP39_007003 [Pinctada imbricata]|uniref:Cysteine dioxygenase n=1 Tax=Pinctada imbricata TaxID=66713 RepID=A0AA88YC02_PINIB|nr:hypothetical protein FSP39_007003 [Pinctada imbricata]
MSDNCCSSNVCKAERFTFGEMIKELHRVFSSNQADIDEVKTILKKYESSREDWEKFALSDPHKYTRNLVDEGNGKFNLLILVWGEGQESSIHDHSDSHCFMKNLEGTIQETRFLWPQEEDQKMKQNGEPGQFGQNDVFYMSDQLGLHRVGNPSHTDRAVTLHLYSPPFDTCKTFDDDTSKAKRVPMTFYSKYGTKEVRFDRKYHSN